MKKEESAVKEKDLEVVEISEFKRSDTRREIKEYQLQEGKKRKEFFCILLLFAAGFLAAILLGLFVFRLSVVTVCITLVVEAVIAVCLHDEPVWVHGLEMLIGIGAGIAFQEPLFMVLGALVYLGVILALHEMKKLNL